MDYGVPPCKGCGSCQCGGCWRKGEPTYEEIQQKNLEKENIRLKKMANKDLVKALSKSKYINFLLIDIIVKNNLAVTSHYISGIFNEYTSWKESQKWKEENE